MSLRATLEQVERASGIRDPQLETCEIPEGFESWVRRYFEMRTGEGVTYADIRAYEEVNMTKLTPVEVAGILAMDRAASAAIAEILKDAVE